MLIGDCAYCLICCATTLYKSESFLSGLSRKPQVPSPSHFSEIGIAIATFIRNCRQRVLCHHTPPNIRDKIHLTTTTIHYGRPHINELIGFIRAAHLTEMVYQPTLHGIEEGSDLRAAPSA